jgi:hypothetical protein
VSNRYVNCSTPSADNHGYSDITVQIEDEELESATDVFRVTVNPVNDAPVLDFIANITANEEDLIQINPNASDADNDTLTYSFTAPLNSTGGWQTGMGDAGSYAVNVSVDDGNGGVDWQIVGIEVLADTTPPASITGLSSPSKSTDWIYWTWTNPADADFAENIIRIDGTNVANTSNNFYNATGLAQNTSYIITVHTKDTNNNINGTNVSDMVTTDAVVLLADLVIDSSRVYTQTPTVGAWTTFEILVKNIGDAAATGVYWLFDTDYTTPENISFGPFDVAVNETVNIYPAVFYNTTGTYNTVFTVDVNNTITEYNETNNQVTIPVNVS